MKRNHRNNKFWLAILLIVALLTPMLPSFAFAEDNGLEIDESTQIMAASESDDAEAAAKKAAEEEAARKAAEEAAAKKAAEEAAAKKAAEEAAAKKAAEEAAAKKAAEEAAAKKAAEEEAARKAAEEEAARKAAEEEAAKKAAEEEAARKAAEEEAARKAAEEEAARKAAEEEAARKAAEEEAARKAAEEEAARKAAEKEAEKEADADAPEAGEDSDPEKASDDAPEASEEPSEEPTAEPTPEPLVTTAPVAAVSAAPMKDVETTITKYNPDTTGYYLTEKPSDLSSVLPAELPVVLGDNSNRSVSVSWSYKSEDASKTDGDFEMNYALSETGYVEADGAGKPKVTLHVVTSDEFTFTFNESQDALTITGWKKSDVSTLTVPEKISGFPVTAIANEAFKGKTSLQTAELPDGLKTIGDEVFKDCTALKQVVFPDSLTKIGKDVFDTANSVETVKLIVNHDTTLTAEDTFKPSDSGDAVKLPKAVTDIEVQAKASDAGKLTISCDLTVENGHGIATKSEGSSKGAIVNTATIVNHGAIVSNGTFTNNGQVYSCDEASSVTGTFDGTAVVTTHVYGENATKCSHCDFIKKTIVEDDVKGVEDKEYTGSEITHSIVVTVDDKTLTEGQDYTLAYTGRINVTKDPHTAIITGIGDYMGEVRKTFYITPKSISEAEVSIANQTYTGNELKPDATVKDKDTGKTLKENEDYTLTYTNNTKVGTATVTVTGKGNYKETKSATFTIVAAPISSVTVSGVSNKTYTGSAQTQSLTLTFNGKTLSQGTDYNVSYSNNINAGTATITITGTGSFTGTRSVTFTIAKASRAVSVSFKSGSADKVYDKTRNLLLKSTDFEIGNVASGDTVKLSKIKGNYGKADVGSYKIALTFEIKQTSTNYSYTVSGITINGKITPRAAIIRPGVQKSTTDTTLVSQSKVYGTADPSSYKGKVGGVMKGDDVKLDSSGNAVKDANGNEVKSLERVVTGKLSREAGENVGRYKITLGTLKGVGNYATTPDLQEGYFVITPKSVNETDVGMVVLGNQKYTGSAIEPTITLKYAKKVGNKTEIETLVKGTDFDVKYSNNVQPGSALVTITGKGNYTGTRSATFRILKVSTTASTTGTSTSSGSGSGSGSSGTSSTRSSGSGSTGVSSAGDGEGDEPDGDEDEENTSDENRSDEDRVNADGELVLDDQPYGTILFGADDMARPFLLYEENIDIDTVEDDASQLDIVDADDDEDEDEAEFDTADFEDEGDEDEDETLDADAENPPKRRLRIEAVNMQDEEGNDLFLDEEETRTKYEQLYLRLTPNQIDVLKSKNFVELVYEFENAELYIPLDELTKEIDISAYEKPEEPEYVAPEDEAEAALTDIGEENEEIEVDVEDDTVLESAGLEMTPNLVSVDQYEINIDQLIDESMSLREKAAVEGKEVIYPYRVHVDAIQGQVKENVTESDEVEPVADEEAPDADKPELKRYSMLGLLKGAELRIILDDDPTEETEQVFVSDDEDIRLDADAIENIPVNAVQTADMTYISFVPEHSGMYTVLDELIEDDEDEDEEEDDEDDEEAFERLPGVTYGPVSTPEPTAIPAPTATPEPTPEPTPEVIEDPDPSYAYSRRSNEGNQYWLVDTVNKTVEYFSEIDNEYWIGDYTGSLMSGMDVKPRTGDKIITIQLKFQQTYKFALMNGDGPELLMEQDDVANVDAQLSAHR